MLLVTFSLVFILSLWEGLFHACSPHFNVYLVSKFYFWVLLHVGFYVALVFIASWGKGWYGLKGLWSFVVALLMGRLVFVDLSSKSECLGLFSFKIDISGLCACI